MPDAGSIEAAAADLAAEFALLPDWEDRFAYIIELGRDLAPLSAAEKTEAARVRGCASQVWLIATRDEGGRLRFRAESDAHIVRGLLAVVLRLFDRRTPQEILAADPRALLEPLGLTAALTPQRSNGLASVIVRIRREAERAAEPA